MRATIYLVYFEQDVSFSGCCNSDHLISEQQRVDLDLQSSTSCCRSGGKGDKIVGHDEFRGGNAKSTPVAEDGNGRVHKKQHFSLRGLGLIKPVHASMVHA